MIDIKWEEPPGGNRQTTKYEHQAIAEQLRANPGRWAKVLEDVPNKYPHMIKNGTVAAYRPPGTFEAVGRNTNNGTPHVDVYARYIGDGVA